MRHAPCGSVPRSSTSGLAVVALLAAVVAGLRPGIALADGPAGPPKMPPRAVRVGEVLEETIRDEVVATGTVEPWVRSIVAAEVEGVVREVALREGSAIPAADPTLVRLSDEEATLRLAAAKARLDAATALREREEHGAREEDVAAARATVQGADVRLTMAKDAAERARILSEGEVKVVEAARAKSLRDEVRAAEAAAAVARQALARLANGSRVEDVAAARAAEDLARAEHDRALLDQRRCVVRSPVGGRVVRLFTDVGQFVARGGPIAEVVDLSRVLVTAGVPERRIAGVVLGTEVIVTVDAYPDVEFRGTVERIVPDADLSTRTFPVRIAVPNPAEASGVGNALRAGMFARVRIAVGAPRKALTAPTDALVRRGEGWIVFTLTPAGTAAHLDIERGGDRGARVEVRGKDLAPGTRLIVSGNEGLQDGADVVVPPSSAPGAGTPK